MPIPVRGQIVLYQHANLRGASRHVFNECNRLTDLNFNDTVSSFVVLSGYWRFYQHANYGGCYAPILGPGIYNSCRHFGIPNDQISSLRC
nr:beta/gamma crystallin family protein [Rhodovulum marinum]